MKNADRKFYDGLNYERAIVSLPNGEVVDGKVQSWTDYEDGDQIQVKIDGVTYLVHASQVVSIEVEFNDIEEYDETLYKRPFDFSCENILPKEKYEIIKGFM